MRESVQAGRDRHTEICSTCKIEDIEPDIECKVARRGGAFKYPDGCTKELRATVYERG